MASVATGWSFPEDSMSCGICLQPFKRPKILPCGHTFCEECLVEAARGGLRCPTCRVRVPLKGGVAALPNNYQVTEMCQKFSELAAAARDATQQWDATCENHPPEKLRLFCQTCEVPVCNQCLDDSAHKGHKNVITVKQAVEKRMTTVTPLLKEKKRQIEERRQYLEKLSHLEEQVDEVKSQDEQAITDLYEEMAWLLSENKQKRLGAIRNGYQCSMRIINESKSEVQQQLQQMNSVKEVEQAIENAGIAFLSDEPEELRWKLAQISVDPLPGPLVVKATVFHPDEVKSGQLTIGRLGTREFSMDTQWKTVLYKFLSSVGNACSYGRSKEDEETTIPLMVTETPETVSE
eukprot:XP_002602828.1 hypothetical protein BRAFLDRAFT_99155 [Branchiostoma floridae]